ncbi:ATP-binding cassette domain-containing protein [Leucobacter denitrificans]|nr:ABC transporter ATP-binding protein [Leucobacter denitrificans]
MSTAEVTRLVDTAMANTTMGFLVPLSQVPVNALTFVGALSVLVVSQPLTALTAFLYLGAVSTLMFFVITPQARRAGDHNRKFSYLVATLITEMIDALKEVTLRGKLDDVGATISRNRRRATRARANVAFLSAVPKYVFEAALIGGFLVVGGVAYLVGGPEGLVTGLTLFAATGFRMMPAMNSVQASITQASSNSVYANDIVNELQFPLRESVEIARDESSLPSNPTVLKLSEVSFSYPGSSTKVLDGLNLEIPIGSSLALVGPSGAGKSTLIDILLGLSMASGGTVELDGMPLESVISQWRSRVGYVPQRVALFDASIAQNVALTWNDDFDSSKVEEVLERVNLSDLLDREAGIYRALGERGATVSGGQQQRIGIARALYSDPFVMVMDEATSALDTATEKVVTDSLNELRGSVTFITVAHRLSTIRNYDQVCYLDSGKILAKGTFDEVVAELPEFEAQARLAGLT